MSGSAPIPAGLAARFVALRLLGEGGMGAVVLARDRQLDRPVAIKLLRRSGPELEARFLHEAEALARLRHPRVVALYDYGRLETGPYMIFEYVAGPALDQGPEGMEPVAAMLQVAAGLEELHRTGLVHRDLKPANILYAPERGAVIIDLGVARDLRRAERTATGVFLGTPSFCAPEVLRGGRATPASDWYAWGATLYALLEGHPPHTTADAVLSMRGARALAPAFARLSPGDPRARLIAALLDPDPDRRPAGRDELEERLAGRWEPLPARPAAARGPTERVTRTWADAPAAPAGRGTRQVAVAPPAAPGRDLPAVTRRVMAGACAALLALAWPGRAPVGTAPLAAAAAAPAGAAAAAVPAGLEGWLEPLAGIGPAPESELAPEAVPGLPFRLPRRLGGFARRAVDGLAEARDLVQAREDTLAREAAPPAGSGIPPGLWGLARVGSGTRLSRLARRAADQPAARHALAGWLRPGSAALLGAFHAAARAADREGEAGELAAAALAYGLEPVGALFYTELSWLPLDQVAPGRGPAAALLRAKLLEARRVVSRRMDLAPEPELADREEAEWRTALAGPGPAGTPARGRTQLALVGLFGVLTARRDPARAAAGMADLLPRLAEAPLRVRAWPCRALARRLLAPEGGLALGEAARALVLRTLHELAARPGPEQAEARRLGAALARLPL